MKEPSPTGESSRQILATLSAPMREMRFLLDRGYRRAHVLRFVGEHHQLTRRDRNVLERVVFPRDEQMRRRKRLLSSEEVAGRALVIDGYNVLVSLACLLDGEPLFLADDGVVRDIAGGRGIDSTSIAKRCLPPLCSALADLRVKEATMIFDQQVSRSGQLASATRLALDRLSHELRGTARTERQADRAVIDAAGGGVACSSDRVIINAVDEAFDIVRYIAGEKAGIAGSSDVDRESES